MFIYKSPLPAERRGNNVATPENCSRHDGL